MERTFAAARDAVMWAERAWTEFAARVAAWRRRSPGCAASERCRACCWRLPWTTFGQDCTTVRAHVQTDPLGAEGELQSQVEPALAEVSRRIEQAMQIAGQLRAARVRFEQFAQIHADAVTACAEAEEKVAGAPALPALVPEEKVQGLLEWLASPGAQARRRCAGAGDGGLAELERGGRGLRTAGQKSL